MAVVVGFVMLQCWGVALGAVLMCFFAWLLILSDLWRWPNLSRRNRSLTKIALRVGYVAAFMVMMWFIPAEYLHGVALQFVTLTLPAAWMFWRVCYEIYGRGKWKYFVPPAPMPGWYPDLSKPGWLRWWDGQQWTNSVAPREPYQALRSVSAGAGGGVQ